jgi:hypothetical protein
MRWPPNSEDRAAWSGVGGVVTVLAGGGAIAWVVAAAPASSGLPVWPIYGFGVLAIVGLYFTLAPLLHLPPWAQRSSPPAIPTDSSSQGTEGATEPPPPPKKPNVIDVTPEYLAGLFKGLTSIQGQKLADTYLGKWMKVSGPLGDVGEFDVAGTQVVFNHGTYEVIVYMWFHDEDYVNDRLSILKKGDRITVLGEIDRIRSVDVQLKHCQLVDADA